MTEEKRGEGDYGDRVKVIEDYFAELSVSDEGVITALM